MSVWSGTSAPPTSQTRASAGSHNRQPVLAESTTYGSHTVGGGVGVGVGVLVDVGVGELVGVDGPVDIVGIGVRDAVATGVTKVVAVEEARVDGVAATVGLYSVGVATVPGVGLGAKLYRANGQTTLT